MTSDQLSSYRNNGYLHAPGVIPPDLLGLMRTVLSRWADDTIDGWLAQGLIDDPQTGLDFQHRLAHLWEAAGRPAYIRSPRRDLVSREMFDILVHPALLMLAQDLLCTTEVSVHGVFNARPKLPDQIWTQTPWHQDAQYYRDAEHVHVILDLDAPFRRWRSITAVYRSRQASIAARCTTAGKTPKQASSALRRKCANGWRAFRFQWPRVMPSASPN